MLLTRTVLTVQVQKDEYVSEYLMLYDCSFAAQAEILYTKRSVVAPYSLQRTHAISVEEIARRVGYPECQTSWAINEMLRFSKQRFFSKLQYIRIEYCTCTSTVQSYHLQISAFVRIYGKRYIDVL